MSGGKRPESNSPVGRTAPDCAAERHGVDVELLSVLEGSRLTRALREWTMWDTNGHDMTQLH